jgi:hypothetical protein
MYALLYSCTYFADDGNADTNTSSPDSIKDPFESSSDDDSSDACDNLAGEHHILTFLFYILLKTLRGYEIIVK